MRRLHSLRMRVAALLRRRRLERDLADEMAFHLEMAASETGSDPRRTFGNLSLIREQTREQWLFHLPEALVKDLRYGVRDLARRPSFSVAAVLVLALGIGANTAVFSIANALLIRPLPGVHAPWELLEVGRSYAGTGFETLSYPNFLDIEKRADTLSDVAAYESVQMPLDTGQGARELVTGQAVTDRYFRVMRPSMQLGRAMVSSDEIVLSDALWRRAFASDPGVIGRRIRLNGRSAMVAGVTGPDFCGVECGGRPDVWIGLQVVRNESALLSNRALNWLRVVARIRAGVNPGTATAQLRSIGSMLAAEYPNDDHEFGLAVNTRVGMDPKSRSEMGAYLRLLAWVTVLVLATACANVTSLLLARATARRSEIATRLAIGAGRARIIRQLITETLLLWTAAGLTGLVLAWWLTDWVSHQTNFPPSLIAFKLRPDTAVLAFSLLLSIASGLLSGLAPALHAVNVELATLMKEDQRAGGGRLTGRDFLIAAQVAVSLALVTSAGLLIRSLSVMEGIQLGFETSEVWLAECSLSGPDASFANRVVEQVRRLPGVTGASLVAVLPMRGRSMDGPVNLGFRSVPARFNMVGDGHFATLRIAVREGREFTGRDTSNFPPVALINETFARTYNAKLGDIIRAFPDNLPREVVGIVADHVYSHLRETVRPTVYRPFAQQPVSQFSFEVRCTAMTGCATLLTEGLRQVGQTAAIGRVIAMDELYRGELWQSKVTTMFVMAFAGLAMLLSAVGLYGAVAYSAARRQHEIGVRLALGAKPADILKLFMGRIGLVMAGGLAAGAALTIGLTGVLRSQLVGVTSAEPATMAAAGLVLLVVAGTSALVPASRAARVDPASVLRDQ